MIEAVQRLLAQKSSNSATSFAVARVLGYDVAPQAVNWMLNNSDQRPANPYDVAFLIASARRITAAMSKGKTPTQAGAVEKTYIGQHDDANDARDQSLLSAQQQMIRGGPTVGWYAHYDKKTSPACRLASGNNFDAMEGTVIGYPGSVHPHCRCSVGPPHPNGGWVNDILQATPVSV